MRSINNAISSHYDMKIKTIQTLASPLNVHKINVKVEERVGREGGGGGGGGVRLPTVPFKYVETDRTRVHHENVNDNDNYK